jgi:hypothetical protein
LPFSSAGLLLSFRDLKGVKVTGVVLSDHRVKDACPQQQRSAHSMIDGQHSLDGAA